MVPQAATGSFNKSTTKLALSHTLQPFSCRWSPSTFPSMPIKQSNTNKPNKRSISKPNNISMPSSSSSQTPHSNQYRRLLRASLVPAVMALGLVVIFLLSISSITWRSSFSSVDRSFQNKIYGIQVLNEFPHDPRAFTQGLLYAGNGRLLESTGLYGQSSVRRVALQTGKVEVLQKMDRSYFGEGLTLLGERLFQVTWLTKTGFLYDRNNLSKIGKFTHQMQDGWGLSTDGKVLFGSDGTSTLYQLDPHTLRVTGKHIVKYNDLEVRNLNELEFVNGEVWANVWQGIGIACALLRELFISEGKAVFEFKTDCIARISQKDGNILGWILLQKLRKGLIEAGHNGIDVLNGIAWDSKDNRLFVTGKLWPKLYEIKLFPINKHISDRVVEQLCIP